MKSSFFLNALLFCLLTVITNGQNLLSQQAIENFKKSKGGMLNPGDDIRTHEKNLLWQVSTINSLVNKKKNSNILKLNSSKYYPATAVVDDTLRYTYSYDNNGNRLTWLDETWTNNAWVNDWRWTYTYDKNGNELTEQYESWTNNAWEIYSRYTYTYDINGNRLTYLFAFWSNNVWVNSWRGTSTYDNNGNELTEIEEVWTNNVWVNDSRWTYTYDNNGNWLTYIYERWTNNAWTNNSKGTTTYDNNGNMLTQLYEAWTNNTNTWGIYFGYTYTYDINGNRLTYLRAGWSNNVWVNSWRGTSTYDNNGNELTEIEEVWTNNAWVNDSRWTYTYDNNGNAIKGESFNWTNNSWMPARGYLVLFYNLGTDFLYFENGAVVNVTYTLITTDIKDNKLTANAYSLSQNYPNPFNPSTVIQYALPYESNVSITVYNTLGEVVKTFSEGAKQTGSYNVNFNGEGLSSGIYLYSINAVSIDGKQNFQATKKMILIK